MTVVADPCEEAVQKHVRLILRRAPTPARANAPWSDEEVELLLTQVPTWENITRLARVLGRTKAAVAVIYELAYSGKWLKDQIRVHGDVITYPDRSNVFMKIATAKKKLGIIVGHRPR